MSNKKAFRSAVQPATTVHGALLGWTFLLAGAILAQGAQPPAGVAPVSLPKGGFGIDGDPMSDVPDGGVGDWTGSAEAILNGGVVLDATGMPIHPIVTHHYSEPITEGGKDTVFLGSNNWLDDPNTWEWKVADPSKKTDISDVWVHVAASPDRHLWAMVGAGRAAADGDSRLDFEFLQNRLEQQDDGTFASDGPDGGRTVNDLLVALEFAQGGATPELSVWRWQVLSNGDFGYVEETPELFPGRVLAAVNRSSVTLPTGPADTQAFVPNAFAEVGVDLTALLAQVDPCYVQTVQTLMVKTEVSMPPSSVMKDFIGPIQLQLSLPNAVAGADLKAFAKPSGTDFSVVAADIGGLYPNATVEWSVVEGSAVVEEPLSITTMVHVESESAKLRATVTLESGCTFTDEISLITVPLTLEIIKEGPEQTYLRWPSLSPDYHLESSDTVVSPNWQTFETSIEERDGFYYAQVTCDQDQKFFRLAEGPLLLAGSQ